MIARLLRLWSQKALWKQAYKYYNNPWWQEYFRSREAYERGEREW